MREVDELEDQVTAKKGTKNMGRNVRGVRVLSGLSPHELADLLGIKPQTVRDYENSKTLSKPTLEKIAEALKVSPEFIEDFNEEAFYPKSNIINAGDISNGATLMNSIIGEFINNVFPLKETVELFKEELNYYREQYIQHIDQLSKKNKE